MAITSVNMTRISNNMQTASILESLRRNTLSLYTEQNRVASGNRFTAPSEDPVNATKAVQLTEVLERQEQMLANIRHADSFLSVTDSAIGEVNDLLTEAYSIASEMVNTTSSDDERTSMAELINGMIDELVAVGNRRYNGVQLFGGQQTTTTPFTQSTGGVEYRGDTGSLTTNVDYGQDVTYNLNGSELFGMLSSQVSGCVDLNPAVTAETRLSDLKGAAGAGVTSGLIRVSTTTPPSSFTVDLTGAETVGDAVDFINAAAAKVGLTVGAGAEFNAAINAANTGIDITLGGGTITVADVGQGVTARDLGLTTTAAAGVTGGDLQPKLTTTTPISSLFGGAGATLGSISIQNGNSTATVDLSGASTVGDVLNAITACGLSVEAKINDAGTGIDVVNRVSGARLSVGEAGGNTAQLLGIRSFYGGTTLSSLNDGDGVGNNTGEADFRIVTRDGSRVDVNLDGAKTIDDVLNAINTAAATAGVSVTASLATTGNGIQLVDGTSGSETFRVVSLNASTAAEDLGILGTDSSGTGQILGTDVAAIQTDSVFTALFELYDALTATNPSNVQEAQITAAAEKIKGFMESATQLQGIVGARSQAMTTRKEMTEDAVVSTQALLSEVKDLDYTEAVTKFQAAQTALQGNLMTSSRMMQMSLLDFLS